MRDYGGYQWFFLGFLVAFVILHLLLFGFYPQFKSNIEFALLVIAMAFLVFLDLGVTHLNELVEGFENTRVVSLCSQRSGLTFPGPLAQPRKGQSLSPGTEATDERYGLDGGRSQKSI